MRRGAIGLWAAFGLGAGALAPPSLWSAELAVREGDHVVHDFRFASGETLPEVRLHYRTLGAPVRDAGGVVRWGDGYQTLHRWPMPWRGGSERHTDI